MRRQHLFLLTATALLATLLAVFLDGTFRSAEDDLVSLKYRLRGNRLPDSNIVIVYIDDAAIRSLGWPVRRNFHALLLKALTDLRVRAIGLEVMFEDRRPEYAEYDDLLASMTGNAGNVVLASYLTAVSAEIHLEPADTGAVPSFPAVREPRLRGSGLHLPYPVLRNAAAGLGHVNIRDPGRIPPAIGVGNTIMPAFGVEVMRVYLGAARAGVENDDGAITIHGPQQTVRIPADAAGYASLDFPGRLSSYRAYPFLEVLRSYDAVRADRTGPVPVLSFRDKIVLVGVIAEGRSSFAQTPVDPHLPSLALHAAFIDNALHGRFPGRIPPPLVFLFSGVLALGCGVIALRGTGRWSRGGAMAVPAVMAVLSLSLFARAGIDLPLIVPSGVPAVVLLVAFALRHRQMKHRVDFLESEKLAVQQQMHDREARLAALERELVSREASRENARTAELLDEIRRHKAEIRELASRANDLEPYSEEEGERNAEPGEFEGIVYDRAGKMNGVIEFVVKIAGSEAPVLILGESGTGKELVARAIHRRSSRSTGPFVAVNCGALAESLLESELFGHEKGAFTGAVKDKPGRFELADHGTVFLDEIGEVSEGFQLKLLRVVQEGQFERVGGTRTISVDVRVVAATNRNLREAVKEHRFREDLYYRLNVLSVALPPLRERKTDIPALVRYFIEREGGPPLRLSRNVFEALQTHLWRGNVRELESAVKRAVLMARAEKRQMITVKDLGEEIATAARSAVALEDQVFELVRDRKFLRSAVSETADELGGLNRGTVAEYLRGEFLRIFADNGFDASKAVPLISLSTDRAVNDRVRRRLLEYLENIAEGIDRSQPWDTAQLALRPKMKNLPQKYHPFLERTGEAYYRGLWNVAER